MHKSGVITPPMDRPTAHGRVALLHVSIEAALAREGECGAEWAGDAQLVQGVRRHQVALQQPLVPEPATANRAHEFCSTKRRSRRRRHLQDSGARVIASCIMQSTMAGRATI
jgi:hypothetical protein